MGVPGAPAVVRMGVPGVAAFCAVAVLPAGVAAPLTGVDGADPGACGDSLTFSQSRKSERRQDEPKGGGARTPLRSASSYFSSKSRVE